MNVTGDRASQPAQQGVPGGGGLAAAPREPDFTGPDPEGYGLRQATIRSGRRESTATAYLRPALSRKNLAVITEALVTGVAIDDGRAVGVDIERGGQPSAARRPARSGPVRRGHRLPADPAAFRRRRRQRPEGGRDDRAPPPARCRRASAGPPRQLGADGDGQHRVLRHLLADGPTRRLDPAAIRPVPPRPSGQQRVQVHRLPALRAAASTGRTCSSPSSRPGAIPRPFPSPSATATPSARCCSIPRAGAA